YLYEREKLRVALLLNKYPGEFIDKQFNRVFQKYDMNQLVSNTNYSTLREKIIYPGRTLRRPDAIVSSRIQQRILPFYNVSDRKLP
ncbi:unnamed protein product, partial [Rotaria magnacalcarata]